MDIALTRRAAVIGHTRKIDVAGEPNIHSNFRAIKQGCESKAASCRAVNI